MITAHRLLKQNHGFSLSDTPLTKKSGILYMEKHKGIYLATTAAGPSNHREHKTARSFVTPALSNFGPREQRGMLRVGESFWPVVLTPIMRPWAGCSRMPSSTAVSCDIYVRRFLIPTFLGNAQCNIQLSVSYSASKEGGVNHQRITTEPPGIEETEQVG